MAKIIQMKDSEGLVYPISNVYSTEEQVIGTDIDGTRYRKVITTNTPSTTNDSVVATIPENDFVKKIDGLFYNQMASQLIPLNFYYSEQYNAVSYIQFNEIHMKVSVQDYTNCPLEIILEYTKTTD